MANDLPTTNGHSSENGSNGSTTNFTVKAGLAQMLKGGVIMDVVNADQVQLPPTTSVHAPTKLTPSPRPG